MRKYPTKNLMRASVQYMEQLLRLEFSRSCPPTSPETGQIPPSEARVWNRTLLSRTQDRPPSTRKQPAASESPSQCPRASGQLLSGPEVTVCGPGGCQWDLSQVSAVLSTMNSTQDFVSLSLQALSPPRAEQKPWRTLQVFSKVLLSKVLV